MSAYISHNSVNALHCIQHHAFYLKRSCVSLSRYNAQNRIDACTGTWIRWGGYGCGRSRPKSSRHLGFYTLYHHCLWEFAFFSSLHRYFLTIYVTHLYVFPNHLTSSHMHPSLFLLPFSQSIIFMFTMCRLLSYVNIMYST